MGMFDKLLGKKLEPNNKPDNGAESIDQNSLKIIKELGLDQPGKLITIRKVKLDSKTPDKLHSSIIKPGEGLSGELINPVTLGESIKLKGSGQTSPIKKVYFENGKYYVQTATSVYQIERNENIQNKEQINEISNQLIKKFGFDIIGTEMTLAKVGILNSAGNSRVRMGQELSGKLQQVVTLNNPVFLRSESGYSNTSSVVRIYEENGKCLVETANSVYELVQKG